MCDGEKGGRGGKGKVGRHLKGGGACDTRERKEREVRVKHMLYPMPMIYLEMLVDCKCPLSKNLLTLE